MAWALFAILAAMACVPVSYNWSLALPGRKGSMFPLVGGVLAALAIIALPIQGSWRWAWVGLLIEPGMLLLTFAVIAIVRDRRAK